ncbi:TOMM precursor leader peptide-binding protein [Actinokineospora auranticolor]|uniref:Ribosomal protein S12 methylthiotransferase accessory factor n=1 Tax=Actinokineospora auranticolor TaxID=155976 RepID=A0A2S6GF18_9PSEU|nr:TOMM precursor leader peptide-binding protein [Actinokineospora auranticolor]PPK63731.1 ribosomal protein S12 methylthiotransferase accessory factor [Actinokineospora auranticolor]
MTTTTPAPAPLARARRLLQRALGTRHAADPVGPAPVVTALGVRNATALETAAVAAVAAANVHLTGDSVLVGPRGAGCGLCLAIRWQRLRTRAEREAVETGHGVRGGAEWPLLPEYVVDAVWALYRRGYGEPDTGTSRVSRLALSTLAVHTVSLLPEPLCPHCGPTSGGWPDYRLRPRVKPDRDTFRLREPGSYALPANSLANPVCGVLGPVVSLDVTSPTTAPAAGTALVRGYAGLNEVSWSGQADSYGLSRDLAFLEGLERYAGTHRRWRDGLVVAAYDDLGADALDPRTCGVYSDETYATDPMVAPFDPAREIPWERGYSLRDERPVLVPSRLSHYSAGSAADNFVFECSNGCAIGGSLEEAVLAGLLELLERDAFLLSWYGNAPVIELDLSSARGTAVRAMVRRAALHGYDVHAFDTRSDLPVPVVTGLAVRRDGGPGALSFAAGASLDPETALEAALSEVLTYIPHLPRQVTEYADELREMSVDYSKVVTLPDHARLHGLPSMLGHSRTYLEPVATLAVAEAYRDWAALRPGALDLVEDIRFVLGLLAEAGFDVVVVDQTTPEQLGLGLRTVCVIVPGLLPIDFGWARQRALTMPRLRAAAREIRRVPHPFP